MNRRVKLVEVVGTSCDKDEAEAILNRCVQRITAERKTERFGVLMRKRFGVWRVELYERLDS